LNKLLPVCELNVPSSTMVCGGSARPMCVRRSAVVQGRHIRSAGRGRGQHFLWSSFVISAMMKTHISKVVRSFRGQDIHDLV